MKGIWRKFIFVVLIFSLPINLSNVSAITLSGDIKNNVVWLNERPENLKVTSENNCTIEICPPGKSKCISGGSSSYTFRHVYQIFREYGTGIYTAKACNDTKEFYVHELTLDIDDEGIDRIKTYLGDELFIKVKLKLDGEIVTPYFDTFEVFYSEGEDWEKFDDKYVGEPLPFDKYQKIPIYMPLHEGVISLGEHSIKVKATCSKDGSKSTVEDTKRNFLWVNPPLDVHIIDNEIKCPANELCKRDVTVQVIYRAGSIEDFTVWNVEAMLVSKYDIKKVTVNDINCSKSIEECTISMTIPSSVSSGSYDLFITIKDDPYKAQDSIPFESVIEISGEFKDAAGKVVSTEIVLENIETGETITSKTDSNGKYSIKLLPGTYNIAFKFNNAVVAKIYNVSITDFELMSIPGNMIRFDSDHIISGLPSGVNMVKIVVLEFALPSSDVWIYIPYDSKKVNGREENLRVYRCADWNFMKSSCTGEWEQIPANVHTIRDAIEFTTNRSAAFLIGENKWLLFSKLELKDLEVYMGEPVTVDGAVIDNDDNPVNGAVITLSFPEFNISKKAVTSGTGGFSARINAPYSTGNFLLNIKADKEPYSSVNDSRVIRVIRSKELAITGVSDIERINLNKTLNLTLTLMNTGQTNFTKPIYLEVNGIPNDWYSLSPGSIDSLDVNEKRDVSLKIRITPEHCASGCKKYNLVNFVAKSEEITRSISFSLEIIVPRSKQLNQTEEKEEKRGMIGFITFPRFTMPSITSPYLSLTIIVILLILIVNKKKARKSIKKSIRKTGMILYDKRRRTTRKGSGLLSMGKNKALNFRSDVIHQLHKAKSEIGGESKSNK